MQNFRGSQIFAAGRVLLLCLLLATVGYPMLAQSDFVSFGRLTTEQGLSQDFVISIAQDRDGFLWFGTNDGLTRYDGRNCTVFRHRPDDSTSLPDSRISGLDTDPSGRLWVSTLDGICYLNPDTRRFQRVRVPSPLHASREQKGYFSNLSFDKTGAGWALTDSFLMRLDGKTFQAEFFKIPCKTKTESQVFVDSKGRVWVIITGWHLLRFDVQTHQFTYLRGQNRPDNQPGPSWPMWVQEDSRGVIWNADWDQAFYTYNEVRQEFVNLQEGGGIATEFIFEERPGAAPLIWSGGGAHGLWQMDGATMKRTDFPPNLRNTQAHNNTRVTALYRDPKTGIIWIGTELGVEYYDPNGVQFGRVFLPQPANQDQFYSVSSMMPDPDDPDKYWVGVWAVGLFEWNRKTGTFKLYREEDKALFCNEIFDIARDAQGNLWLATILGVERFDPRTRRHRHFMHPSFFYKTDGKILSVEAGPDGHIWQGSNRGRLIETDPAGGRTRVVPLYQHDGSEFPNYMIWNIELDNRGRVLVPSPNGLLRYDPAKKTNDHILYRTPALVVLDAVTGLDQRLYVATVEGVYVLDERDSLVFVLTTKNGLHNQVAQHIDVDRQGNIWIATSNGLHRYAPQSGKIDYFSKTDGLFLSDLTEGFSVLPNGEVFVSGNYSFNLLSPDDRQRTSPPPRITLDGIKVLEEPVEWVKGQTLRLQPGENVITFDIALIQFTQADKCLLSYRLEGFNEYWTDWPVGRRNTITFTNLDAGTYTLYVRARNGDGVWSEETLEIPIEVIPPFYKTWWFYSLCALLLSSVLFGIYRYRRYVRLRLESMQARAVAMEKQQLLNEIALLKTQVNPHFLFNSLSILSSLVHVNADLSEQFIDQLSRSYRYILEQKDQSLVSIRTEMEFIRAYVFLLKIRFENKLDMDIRLDENELDKYKIAPLTLQLLVENAVKHNRMSNKTPLLVIVEQKGDLLEVRNVFRPRGEAVHSTGVGLQNIINRYALLTERPVWAGEREGEFVVIIPLLT